MIRRRVAVSALALSVAGFAAWIEHEGFSDKPYIPTKGDVPTIGYGSTRYEDGTPVTLSDKPITRTRAASLARNLSSVDEIQFKMTIPGVYLHQEEYDLYIDFVGQYGIGNWRKSSMLKALKQGDYVKACNSLLKWRNQGGRDCSLSINWGPKGCKGVWTRQQERHAKCMAAQAQP